LIEISPASKKIIPIPGEYATITDNNVYMGTTDGASAAKGASPDSYDPAAAAAVGKALANEGDASELLQEQEEFLLEVLQKVT